MSKLPSQKKILREDVKGAPDWIDGIIDPVNSFMETVYQTFNRNVTFNDNIASQVKELNVNTTSVYPVMEPIEFQSTLRTKAFGLLMLQAVERLTYTPAVSAVTVNWVENNGTIHISNITGLAASKSYTVRLLLF